MDYSKVGKEIRLLRKTQGISQKALSNGICTQAQISKIESGEVHPLSSTLYLLAKRLGVDVNYFYDVGYAPHHEYLREVQWQIREAIAVQKYDEVLDIIKIERKNPIYQKLVDFKQFITWHEGVCVYYLEKDAARSLDLLEEALQLTKSNKTLLSQREIEIVNSIGIIHHELKDYDKAIGNFEQALYSLKRITYLTEEKLLPRVSYNLARSLTQNEEYEKSIEACMKGIDWCKKYQLLYLMGELYFQLGLNYRRLQQLDLSDMYFHKSINILELLDKKHLVEHIQKRFWTKA